MANADLFIPISLIPDWHSTDRGVELNAGSERIRVDFISWAAYSCSYNREQR
jgi:hypothetical protein